MKPHTLSDEAGKMHAYACGNCSKIFPILIDRALALAASCCALHCRSCLRNYHPPLVGNRLSCPDCEARDGARAQAREEGLFAKATKTPAHQWDGDCLYDDGEYYFSVEELLEHYAENDSEPPQYVWDCDREKLSMSAEHIIEAACEDHHDDAWGEISDHEKRRLQRYLDTWCDATGVSSFEPNFNRAVILEGEVPQ